MTTKPNLHHPPFPQDNTLGGAVMFAELFGISCSLCAPLLMDEAEVEAAAMIMATPRKGPWKAVDKSKPPVSIGAPTPSPCNVYPGRQHWFLISGGCA